MNNGITKEKFDALVNTVFYYSDLVNELMTDIDVLDAQMIALGNLMIKKGVVSRDELKNYTDGVFEMKISEKRRERNYGMLGKSREEAEEILSTKFLSVEDSRDE